MVALTALVLERLFGYPQAAVARIGHPVMWMGAVIAWGEMRLNDADRSFAVRRALGVAWLITLVALVLAITVPLMAVLRALPMGWGLEAVLASTLLAQKELGRAVGAVARGLGATLAAGRAAVSAIVGRDTESLDAAGVARAAIETLAESLSDGVVAPLFWLALFGLPGIAVYKAVNTADSMIGHKDARHAAFGWAAARLDDLLNLVPARLSAALVALAALMTPDARAGAALATAWRDAKKHESPNAGWPEAAMAGALGIALGGPRAYEGETIALPTLGVGRRDLGARDIDCALTLYRRTLDVLLVAGAALALLVS